jgi:hypothetical protein
MSRLELPSSMSFRRSPIERFNQSHFALSRSECWVLPRSPAAALLVAPHFHLSAPERRVVLRHDSLSY